MKLKFLLLAVCLFSLLGYAKAEFQKCVTVSITCEGGGGTNYSSCGTYDSLTKEIAEVRSFVCN